MCVSQPFSHDQSLCHELVQPFSEALSLRGDRRHCFKNGKDRSPCETLLSPAIFFFFERDELKCSSEQVCHELGGDGYLKDMRAIGAPCCLQGVRTWKEPSGATDGDPFGASPTSRRGLACGKPGALAGTSAPSPRPPAHPPSLLLPLSYRPLVRSFPPPPRLSFPPPPPPQPWTRSAP